MNKLILALFLTCSAIFVKAQNAEIHGKITTSDGEPLGRVSVVVQGTKWGAVSKEDGTYQIKNIKPGEYVVEVSLTGNIRDQKQVDLNAGSNQELDFNIGETTKELSEVVVETNKIMNRTSSYASKMPLNNLENAQVVSSIPDVILRKQIAITLEDAMKNATGVTKLWDATSRPDGGALFVSRGFMTTTKARNGLPNIVNTNVDMANLDKIEVIKGPTGTLYGSIINSYGGLINRITKRPYFYNGGYVDVAYGSYNFMRASADANFVLQKDKMAARINVAGQNQDSWQDAGFQKSYIIAPSFVYKPNDRFTLNADAEIVGSSGNSNGGNFMFILTPSMVNGGLNGLLSTLYPNNPEAVNAIMAKAPKTIKEAFGTDNVKDIKVDYDRSFISNDLYSKTNTNSFFADASYRISDHWTSQTAFTYSLSHNNGYAPFQYLVPNYLASFLKSAMTGTPDFGAPGADSVARMVWRPVGETKTLDIQQNFVADYTFGKIRNRAVIGVDYLNYRSDVTYYYFNGLLHGVQPYPYLFDMVGADGGSASGIAFNKPNVDAAYQQRGTVDPPYESNQHSAAFSGYINNITNITDYLVVSAGVRVDNFDDKLGNKTQTKFSPKFGLIFMPVKDQLSLFANYQNGFTNQFGTDKNNRSFDPEEANQKEVGIKYALLGNRLTGTISYYDILVKNIVRQDPTDGNFSIQDGEQKSKGIEVDVLANPVNGWTLLLGYGYNDSKMQKATADVNGLRPESAGPYNTLNFWTNYSFTKTAVKGLGIGVSLNYSGESYAINSNLDGRLMLPAATILGGHLTYDLAHFRIGLKVNNITNEKYWKGWSNFIPQMPRQLIGTIAYKF